MSKVDEAIAVFNANPGVTNPTLIQLLVEQVGLTKLGARTYAYNIRKLAVDGVVPPQTPKVRKAPVKKVAVAPVVAGPVEDLIDLPIDVILPGLEASDEVGEQLTDIVVPESGVVNPFALAFG